MAPNGLVEAGRRAEGEADRQAHVGHRELGDGGAVGELDHAVHDRLRVHDHVDPVEVDAEQLVGLDHLEALVHERRRVDRDLGAHVPGRVLQRVGDRDVAELGAACGPRNGPPLAVSTMRAHLVGGAAAQAW